jgi:hypothetical protein
MLLLASPYLFLRMGKYAFRMRELLYHSLCYIKTHETALTMELLNTKMDYEKG